MRIENIVNEKSTNVIIYMNGMALHVFSENQGGRVVTHFSVENGLIVESNNINNSVVVVSKTRKQMII